VDTDFRVIDFDLVDDGTDIGAPEWRVPGENICPHRLGIYWRHWNELAKDDPSIWGHVAERIVSQREAYWSPAKSARLKQIATTGSERFITYGQLLPGWALRLRELSCLPDTHRVHRKPGELMRRTPETESLLDIEPFIHALLDRESSRPILDLLGVRHLPLGPTSLLDRLRVYYGPLRQHRSISR
jgi:hypothetical protein